MGCCGCTLHTTAIVAAVFGLTESLAGLVGGIIFAEVVNYPDLKYYTRSIRNVMISASVFNALWLTATIILIIGIFKENALMHRLWVGATSVIMVVDLAHTIALIVGIVNTFSDAYISTYEDRSYNIYNKNFFDDLGIPVYVLVMTAVSRGSFWLWIINICLTIYTARRADEIERGPVQTGTTQVLVYGNQPVQPYLMTGQTIIIQHSGPAPDMPPSYDYQQPQYGQPQTQYGQQQTEYGQPQTQYGQSPANPPAPYSDMPPKY